MSNFTVFHEKKKKKNYKTPNQQHVSPKKFQKIPNPTAIQCSGQGKISQYYYTITFREKKNVQNTQSTTSLAKKIPKNSQPYRNPMLWARKNLTILLHNNIHYFSKSDSIELIWPIKISFPGNIQQNFTECHQNQQVPPGIITNIPTDNKKIKICWLVKG